MRKDYKEWDNIPYNSKKRKNTTTVKMGISSVGLSLDAWCKKEGSTFFSELRRWNRERSLDLLLCMNSFTDEQTGKFARQLVVYVDDDEATDEGGLGSEEGLFERFLDFLRGNGESKEIVEGWDLRVLDAQTSFPTLDLHALPKESRIAFLSQGNTRASRKVISPILMEGFFHYKCSTE